MAVTLFVTPGALNTLKSRSNSWPGMLLKISFSNTHIAYDLKLAVSLCRTPDALGASKITNNTGHAMLQESFFIYIWRLRCLCPGRLGHVANRVTWDTWWPETKSCYRSRFSSYTHVVYNIKVVVLCSGCLRHVILWNQGILGQTSYRRHLSNNTLHPEKKVLFLEKKVLE